MVVDDFHFFFALANAEQIHQVLHQQNGGGLSRRMSRGMSSNFKIFYSMLLVAWHVNVYNVTIGPSFPRFQASISSQLSDLPSHIFLTGVFDLWRFEQRTKGKRLRVWIFENGVTLH